MPANHTEIEKRLWDAADELRANSRLRASEYSVPVLGLIFLKYADHKFAHADRQPRTTTRRRQRFEQGRRRTEAEKLRGVLNARIQRLVRRNRSRANYQQEFQQLIDEYNQGSSNVERFFNDLVDLARRLDEEEQRHIAENLTEEELVLFDVLTRPDVRLSEEEARQVKQVARDLLEKLKREKLVLDWRKRQQARADVRLTIEELLDRLPARYTAPLYQDKCQQVYTHIYDAYYGGGQGVYAAIGH